MPRALDTQQMSSSQDCGVPIVSPDWSVATFIAGSQDLLMFICLRCRTTCRYTGMLSGTGNFTLLVQRIMLFVIDDQRLLTAC